MALYSRFVVVLLYGWSSVCVCYCAMLKTDLLPERRRLDFTHTADKSEAVRDEQDLLLQDTMTEHMQMLYTKYNQAGFPFKDGNTVRSFKAHWGRYPKPLGHVRIYRCLLFQSLNLNSKCFSIFSLEIIGTFMFKDPCGRKNACAIWPVRHKHVYTMQSNYSYAVLEFTNYAKTKNRGN